MVVVVVGGREDGGGDDDRGVDPRAEVLILMA